MKKQNPPIHTLRLILIKMNDQNPDFSDEGIFTRKCIFLWVLYLSTYEEVMNIF